MSEDEFNTARRMALLAAQASQAGAVQAAMMKQYYGPTRLARYFVSDGYGEQGPDTDGLAKARVDVAALCERVSSLETALEVQARQAKLWEDRCIQLTAERDALGIELAKRMALPARALRYGGVR